MSGNSLKESDVEMIALPSKSRRSGMDFITAMGKNRATRRRLAKASGGKKIVGSMKPHISKS